MRNLRQCTEEVFDVLGGVLNTDGNINNAFGYSQTQKLTSTATKFFEGFAKSDPETYRTFLSSLGDGQEFHLDEFVSSYNYSLSYGFSKIGANHNVDIYSIVKDVLKQQLLEQGLTSVTRSGLLTASDIENYHRAQSVEPTSKGVRYQSSPTYWFGKGEGTGWDCC